MACGRHYIERCGANKRLASAAVTFDAVITDLRAIYLSSEDLNARRVAPMVSQDRLINHRNNQIMWQVQGRGV